MELKIDLAKVVKILAEKDNNNYIEYTVDNGTIVDVSIVPKEEDKIPVVIPTDRQMIDAIKNSSFMKELEEKKKEAIENKTEENISKVKSIIELDKNGTLDMVAADYFKKNREYANGTELGLFDNVTSTAEKLETTNRESKDNKDRLDYLKTILGEIVSKEN